MATFLYNSKFYYSKIEALQNCSVNLGANLSFERKSERIVFNKTQALGERGGNIALGNKI